MSRDVMIGLLRKGKTGSQILEILDAISNNEEPVITKPQPTLEELTFWPFIVTHLETSPIVYPTQSHMTNTISYTERLNNRYQAIDDVITDTPLWLILTDAMCAKYDNTELTKLGQGQSSKLNMLERRVVSTFGAYVRAMDGINQRVDDNNMNRKFLVVDNNMADEVRQYVTEQQFW